MTPGRFTVDRPRWAVEQEVSEVAWGLIAPMVFGLLAAVYGVLAWREERVRAGTRSPALKTRLRIAVIFAAVSVVLFLLQARDWLGF